MEALQTEIHEWHLRNYPKDDIESALLGVEEEHGELCRAQLKQDGGIRGTWDEWQTEKVPTAKRALLEMSKSIHDLVTTVLEPSMYTGCIEDAVWWLYCDIITYCYCSHISFSDALFSRWDTISKRDFIANPQTGGREVVG